VGIAQRSSELRAYRLICTRRFMSSAECIDCDAVSRKFPHAISEFPDHANDIQASTVAIVIPATGVQSPIRRNTPATVPNENSVQPMADVIPLNRTAELKQFAALVESDERYSAMHACSRKHSSDTDFKAPGGGSA